MTGAVSRLRGQAGQNPPPQPLPLHKGEGLRAAQALRGGHMPPPLRGEGVRGRGFGASCPALWPWQVRLRLDGIQVSLARQEAGLRAAPAPRGGHMPPPRRGEGVRGWDLDHQPGHGQAALAGG